MNDTVVPLLDDRCAVHRRPHFTVDGSGARFLISARAHKHLTRAEQSLWDAIHPPRCVRDIRADLGEESTPAIQQLWQAGMVEIVPPISSATVDGCSSWNPTPMTRHSASVAP